MVDDRSREKLLEAARSMVTDRTAIETVAALAESGVPCLLLRGPALGVLLYEHPAERSYSDVDLLIPPDELSRAEAALSARGFQRSPLEEVLADGRPTHAGTWQARSGAFVDVHRTLVGIGSSPEVAWATLSRESETIELEGYTLDVPSTSARAVVVALHAAQHVDDSARALDDLERALSRLPENVWEEAASLAESLDARESFAAGLALSESGRRALERLGIEHGGSIPKDAARGGRAFHVAQAIAWLGKQPGARAKLSFVRRRLVPSARTMRRRSALARRGKVGLALSYVLRWADAASHLPEAIAALRRVRRSR